jgi:hypothetical protein
MSTSPDKAASIAILDFQQEMAEAKEQHAALIAELEAELLGLSYELSDSYMTFTDELAASLGAEAANECSRESDQDSAIGQCELFVSSEISADPMSLVSACIAFHGAEQGSAVVNKMVSESPLRDDLGVKL